MSDATRAAHVVRGVLHGACTTSRSAGERARAGASGLCASSAGEQAHAALKPRTFIVALVSTLAGYHSKKRSELEKSVT